MFILELEFEQEAQKKNVFIFPHVRLILYHSHEYSCSIDIEKGTISIWEKQIDIFKYKLKKNEIKKF